MPRRRRWYSQNNPSTEATASPEGQPSGEGPRDQSASTPRRRPRKNNQPRPAVSQRVGEPSKGEQSAQAQDAQVSRPRRPRRNNQPPQRQPRPYPPPTESSETGGESQPRQDNRNRRADGSRQGKGQRYPDRAQFRGRSTIPAPAEVIPSGEVQEPNPDQPGAVQNPPQRDGRRQEGQRRDQFRRGQGKRGISPQGTAPTAPREQGQPRRGDRPDNRRDRRPDLRLSSFSEYTEPIPTNKGIKARSQRGTFSKNWWARRWIEAMEIIVDPHRLQRGRSYARQGQVLSIEETPVGIEARVQGSRPQPYKVTMQLTPLTDEQWDQVISALAEQAIFTAQLLAGEMPEDIEAAFLSAGVSLFPYQAGDLYTDCTCPDWANPCKHVAASHYILGDRFDDDPFLLFRMRGRNQEQILQALRERRSGGLAETETIEQPEIVVQETRPLSEEIDRFWEPVESLDTFPLTIRPPTVDMPLMKRLGEPAFLGGGSIEDILRPVYTTFSRSAFRAAYSEEEPLESSVNGGGNGNGESNEPANEDVVDGTGRRENGSQEGDDDSETSLY